MTEMYELRVSLHFVKVDRTRGLSIFVATWKAQPVVTLSTNYFFSIRRCALDRSAIIIFSSNDFRFRSRCWSRLVFNIFNVDVDTEIGKKFSRTKLLIKCNVFRVAWRPAIADPYIIIRRQCTADFVDSFDTSSALYFDFFCELGFWFFYLVFCVRKFWIFYLTKVFKALR